MKSAWLFVLLWLAGTGQAQERLISVDAQDLPVRIALQLVAQEAGVSIATADSVVGTVTLKLDRIPWRDALTVIARSKGLVVREQNDVLWVGPGPLSDDGDVPLETVTIPIRFHSAAQIAKAITDAKGLASATAATAGAAVNATDTAGAFLSSRGRLFADERSNMLVVSDVPEKITKLKALVRQLDVPAQQVLIEARVVVASERFGRELGSRFGVNAQHGRYALGGNLETTAENISEGSLAKSALMTGLALASPAGAAALSVLRAGTQVDLELQAMQATGQGQIISQPRIITTNQQSARIAQGREIGYVTLQNHGNGDPSPNVAFKEALLELQVTPTITPDGEVFLQVQLKKDELDGYVQTTVGDIPQINKREVTTSVLLRNGQTLVVGGVQEDLRQDARSGLPFLGDLPWLGAWFRKTRAQHDRAELLIFLTPTVLPAQPTQS